MPATNILGRILGMKHTRVRDARIDAVGLTLVVESAKRVGRCGGCLRKVRRVHDRQAGRRWRHLDFGGMRVWLEATMRRLDCPRCGILVELVPWADWGSSFTRRFEDQVGYLAQHANRTVVSDTLGIAWRTVGNVIGRVLERLGPRDLLDNLRRIGVDELSYRRHHEYVTTVVDHDTGRLVWAHPGKNADTLRLFFDALGAERCAKLEVVTADMSAAYTAAIREKAPQAEIVYDRFHVQRLVHDALDEVRRAVVRDAGRDSPDAEALVGTRYTLQRNTWNLDALDRERIAEVQRTNKPVYRALLLKDALVAILNRRQANVARAKLLAWINWASRSRLAPFVKAAKTIRKHLDGIVAYVRTGLSNGRVEGLNGKARTITRRAYGFHDAWSLIAMLFLCCSGLVLSPVRVTPVLPR